MIADPTSDASRRFGWLDVVVLSTCLAIGVVVFVLYRGLRHDDAYITFQYARSIAEGDGFVFTPGERVLGTTTPLFTLLMAVVYAVFGDVVAGAAIAINALAVAAQGALVWALLRDRSPVAGAGLSLAVALGLGGGMAFLALETCLFAALVFATVFAISRRRDALAGVFLGLAFLTRYDAGLLVLVVVGWSAIERRELPRKTLAVSLAIVLPWLVFAQAYFGSVLPHTLGAKHSLTPPTWYLEHYGRLALTPLFELNRPWFGPTLALGCAMLGVRWAWRSCRALIPLVVYAAGHTAVYAWLGPPRDQHWHMYVPLIVARLLIVLGVVGTLEALARRRSGRTRAALLAIAATASSIVCVSTARTLWRHGSTHHDAYWLGARHAKYEHIAQWLGDHVEPGRTVMATEFGTIGYLTRRTMIDPLGLINETNAWSRTRRIEDLLELIARYRPDVILFSSEHDATLACRASAYRIVHVFPWKGPLSIVAARDRTVLTSVSHALWPQTHADGR